MTDDKLHITPIDNEQLSYKAKVALLELIRSGGGTEARPFKLPNEDDLSQRLGVSRNVLRDALGSLEEMGIVTRRRGRGTIANPRLADTRCRLDVEPELEHMFRSAGYSVQIQTPRLGVLAEGDPAFRPDLDWGSYLAVEKSFTLEGGMVAAYCVDHISPVYAKGAEEHIAALEGMSHFQFLSDYCGTSMAYTLAHLDIYLAEPWLAGVMNIPEGEPLLLMDDFAYNYDHQLLAHTNIYFRRGILDLKFLRKNW